MSIVLMRSPTLIIFGWQYTMYGSHKFKNITYEKSIS